ncbi:hypothetical protein [Mesorhizobium sp. M8A.F.Ca.ET.021.01.1.1]|uniref:hypothetical protein n=1 Tax=Mesorhizobium sp. M8A.F.Ca.ET.021.01.1.1 TaxID=2496757 RepID=UPI001AECB0D0|nr:hypothetical protein [Mesorhizobium sp. M8A.F.Ca.ET.021.01.1.1]
MSTPNYGLPVEDARFISLEDMVKNGFETIDKTMKAIADAAGQGGGSALSITVVETETTDFGNLLDLTQQNTFVTFDHSVIDDGGALNPASMDRIIIPAGATRVKLTAISASYTPGPAIVVLPNFRGSFVKNGATALNAFSVQGVTSMMSTSLWSPVVPGDYIQLILSHDGDGVTEYDGVVAMMVEFA